MTNPPKARGTASETAVLRYLTARGLPNVARRTLTGNRDTGDIWVDGGRVVVEAKSRNRPHSYLEVETWLAELDREVAHAASAGAGVDMGALVVKRVGSGLRNVGDWHVYVRPGDATYLLSGVAAPDGAGWFATTLEQWTFWVGVRLKDPGPYGRLG